MEISAIEINLLCSKISEATREYFVSGIYSMEDGILLRLNHATKPERLVAVSSFASWITTKNLSIAQATKFVTRLRELERFGLVSVSQVGNERIAEFSFKSRKDEKRDLFAEFFSRGNVIVTDPEKENVILEVENPQTFRHRSLQPGEQYRLPPSRGIPLQEIDYPKLLELRQFLKEGESADLGLPSIRWFGRIVGTSRKFVEEIFFRAKVSPNSPVKSLTPENLEALATASNNLLNELKESTVGYVLLPNDETEDANVDVCPIIPNSWRVATDSGHTSIVSFPSLSDALDEVLVQAIVLERRQSVSQKTRAKAAELTSALEKQEVQVEQNRAVAEDLRATARGLMTSRIENAATEKEIIDTLLAHNIVEISKESGNQPRFVTEPRAYLRTYSGTALGSRLFDEAKRLDSESRKIEEVMKDLEDQRTNLYEITKSQEEKAERKLITERRERQWFERYRWFVTSDGRLALGGRDSTSNSIVINKYTGNSDVVFHADLYGSPFFVLKNEKKSESPPDDIALEMAQATVSFSRAWKDELGSADAYWVFSNQVKKSAPSGEYLSRGSFFIEGKKNFVKHVKVELSIGVMPSSRLPTMEKISDETEELSPTEEASPLLVVCGPEKSIAGYCHSRVKIAPGKERGTVFARRLKQQLVNKIKDLNVKETSKKIPLDEIIRVLPAGSYKIVSEKQNN